MTVNKNKTAHQQKCNNKNHRQFTSSHQAMQ